MLKGFPSSYMCVDMIYVKLEPRSCVVPSNAVERLHFEFDATHPVLDDWLNLVGDLSVDTGSLV